MSGSLKRMVCLPTPLSVLMNACFTFYFIFIFKGLNVEGLFRVPGPSALIDELRKGFEEGMLLRHSPSPIHSNLPFLLSLPSPPLPSLPPPSFSPSPSPPFSPSLYPSICLFPPPPLPSPLPPYLIHLRQGSPGHIQTEGRPHCSGQCAQSILQGAGDAIIPYREVPGVHHVC